MPLQAETRGDFFRKSSVSVRQHGPLVDKNIIKLQKSLQCGQFDESVGTRLSE